MHLVIPIRDRQPPGHVTEADPPLIYCGGTQTSVGTKTTESHLLPILFPPIQ